MTGLPAHESVADTRNDAPGGRVGVQNTAGRSVSATTTFWIAVLWLPAASVAVHVTGVRPAPYVGGALFVNVTAPSQSSVALGIPRFTGPQPLSVRSSGTKVNVGFVVSTIVTVWVSVATRCSSSSARQ